MKRRLLVLIALALLAAPASADAALRKFGGLTADEQPLVIAVNSRTGNVDRITAMFTSTCGSNRTFAFGHRLTRRPGSVSAPQPGQYPMTVRKRAGGRFTATAVVFEALANDKVARVSIAVRGRVRGASIGGTIEGDVAIGSGDSGAQPEETCTYRRRSFGLIRAPGRVLSGETSQSLPVVVQLAPRARSVQVLHIGWNANCEPPGFIQIPDELLRFRIRGGRFGDDFDFTTKLDDGTERVFRYKLHGRASRVRASGTLSVDMEDRGGPAPGTCRSGPVRWSAS